ncbi:hypothetical protein SSX86_030011 [Deinandra increscens subsp. villosa]|uniref:Syntaxin N-terminal domain-containing protein n=1 Tax=Deinandra increscens subsp. villosa TaxID=3103831 RepID=A0AAP0CHE5_9ASTR
MNSIRETLAQLESANQESRSLHNPDLLKSNRRRINGDVVNVLKKARTIKSRLEEMDRANAESRRLSGCRQRTPVDRTRTARGGEWAEEEAEGVDDGFSGAEAEDNGTGRRLAGGISPSPESSRMRR